jgi:hypothetical protein
MSVPHGRRNGPAVQWPARPARGVEPGNRDRPGRNDVGEHIS